jgi:hypothetical protein
MTSAELAAVIGIICTFIFGIIAIIYFNRSYKLMSSIDVKKWSEISDHYAQIKYLKEAKWKM